MSRPRKVRGLVLLGALAIAASAAPAAPAAMTHSQVSVDKTYDFLNEDALTPPVRHITATSDGAMGEAVDILCLRGANENALGSTVSTTLGAGGTLDYNLPEGTIRSDRCRLAVVPSGQTTADPGTFAGPTVGGGYFDAYSFGDRFSGFGIEHAYEKTYADLYDLGDCGLCDMALLRPDNTRGSYLFFDNAYLESTHSEPGGGQRPDLVVDGKRAYTPYEADTAKPGWLGLTVTHAQDPDTGDMSYVEEEPLVFCQPDDTTCSSYTPTAIHWKRTVHQDHGGRMVWITDELTNTDTAASHDYDLDFEEYEASSGHNGFRFPGGSNYGAYSANDVVDANFGPVSTIGFILDSTAVTTDENNPVGTLTVSPTPVRALFLNAHGFNLQFKGTIPAGGKRVIRQVFSMGTSQAEVDGYAAQAVGELGSHLSGPAVAITAPAADGSTVDTQTITVKGTASDDGGITSLRVNGAAVTLAGDGTWSAPVTLAEGANTITALAQDADGNDATATRTVTYAKPPPPPPPPPAAAVATITKNGKVKLTRKGKKLILDTGMKVACPAGTASCTATVSARTTKAIAAALRKRRLTIAKKAFTIPAGTTRRIVLTLTARGARALRRNRTLKVEVALAARVGAGASTLTSRTITIRYPKPRR